MMIRSGQMLQQDPNGMIAQDQPPNHYQSNPGDQFDSRLNNPMYQHGQPQMSMEGGMSMQAKMMDLE